MWDDLAQHPGGQEQLVHLQTDMNPYQMLKLPLVGLEVDWARQDQ